MINPKLFENYLKLVENLLKINWKLGAMILVFKVKYYETFF